MCSQIVTRQVQALQEQEQALQDVKTAAEEAQLLLAEEAKRSAEALKAKCSLVSVISCYMIKSYRPAREIN